MTLFILIWLVLVATAAGLSVGSLRGRELRGGTCGGSACASCERCSPADAVRRSATASGG